jgi:glycosyltransferase involved in cell wall biosynthesis
LGFSRDEFVAGFIGTPRPSKGVHHLVQAINDTGGEKRGLIVGASDEGFGAKLRAQADEDTVFVKPVPHSTIPKYYAALDTLVLAQEQSPLAEYQIPAKVFEGMSMAKPVIATNIGDLPEIIADTGEIIPEPTPTNIIEAMNRLGETLNSKGQSARNRAIENYSEEVIRHQLQDVLTSLVN